jgi:hypothetical protein
MISGYLVGVAANTPVAGQPVNGPGIDPLATVASVNDSGVTLSLPTLANVPEGTAITFGLSIYSVDCSDNLTGLVLDTDYRLDADAGIVFRAGHDYRSGTWHGFHSDGHLVAIYSAGYDPIPDDVQAECIRLVAGLYHAQTRDPLLKSRDGPTYGREEFWIGQAPVSKTLDRYIRIVA